MTPDPTPDLDEIEKRHEYATSALDAACQRGWKMRVSIPAKPNHDDDLVISASLQDIPALLRAARERDELLAERDAARIALGGHATGDFASDDGCGCTMLGLVRLCETHHDWLKQGQAEMKELRARAEKAEADLAESKRLVEKAEARAKELEGLRAALAKLEGR